MLFTLEALDAGEGDCLLLHYGTHDDHKLALIDGGTSHTYRQRIVPRLDQLRDALGLDPGAAVPLELVVVTHTDADHIEGIIELVREVVEAKHAQAVPPVSIARLWHNSFDAEPEGEGAVGASQAGSLERDHEFAAQAASIKQGAELRDAIETLGLGGNPPYHGPVGLKRRRSDRFTLDRAHKLQITVLGPGEAELAGYRNKWIKWQEAARAKAIDEGVSPAAFVDGSKTNMASITALVEMGPEDARRSILLTGDARGDYLLAGLERVGRLKPGGSIHVDALKLPHHGSEHNVAPELFERVIADHYLISANGKHNNPDIATLDMLAAARGSDEITLWTTFAEHAYKRVDGTSAGERARREVLRDIDRWLHDTCPEAWTVRYREDDELSIAVDLGDEAL